MRPWSEMEGLLLKIRDDKVPVLDMRDREGFYKGPRLRGSVHMDEDTVMSGKSCWLLPDKHEPLAVIPSSASSVIAVSNFLAARNWTNITCLENSQELWSLVTALGMHDDENTPATKLRRRLLFKPCALLHEEIGRIEASLLAGARLKSQGSENHCSFLVYEPGCGRARNLAWLALKEHDNVTWRCLGVDLWYSALQDVQDLFQHSGVPPEQACLRFNNICPHTGALQPMSMREAQRGQLKSHTHIAFESTPIPTATCHLILCVRFLERAFLPTIPQLLAPGGFILFCTFVDAEGTQRFGRPRGENHLLQPSELARVLGPHQGLEILRDDTAVINDGRELSMFVARKRFDA
ncbi:hypothetical protein DUNSADRAFT_10354 [Dunaliella salina]|uniref:Uncharacterized protein n=1 Tax=Dunaliella salina TaxID=3046 RepID=A0ABQ7H4Y3_DUNSA|nr:hypothetical protein DUNSADRAFT_10354 [Dunaliella salina]|eukprot:KAF5841917.1 hypothetical protein DUNSADRAFT_10354 [Dunaliella salina]